LARLQGDDRSRAGHKETTIPELIRYCVEYVMKTLHVGTTIIVLLCGGAAGPNLFSAERAHTPGLNGRQQAQQSRIHQGVRSGELTPEERKKLGKEQQALRTEERASKADGIITPTERKDLHQDAKQLSRDIYRQKHDAQASAPRPVPARPPAPGVNTRQQWQRERVAQGVRSGQLTRTESAQIRQEQQSIRAEEKAYRADGKLTVAERKDLHQDLHQASQDIYQQKHDAQTRPRVTPPLAPRPAPTPAK